MPKEMWDLKTVPMSITQIVAMQEKLAQSAFTAVDIVNVSVADLTYLKTALEFYYKLNGALLDIRKSIDELRDTVGLPPTKKDEEKKDV